ncbi:MAG: ABC transporter ATP-binding protein, partial [Thermomicrobiales bacterium]
MAQRNSPKQSSAASPHVGPARGGGPGARFTGEKQRPKNTRATILRIWSYLRRQRRGLIIAVLTIVVTTCLGLAGPYLMGCAIDDYILPGDMPGLARLSLILVGVYALTSLLTWVQAYVMAGVAQRTVRELRTDLFDKLQTLELRFFDQRPHGDTMSRLTNDVDNVNQVLTESVTQIASGILTGTGVVILMLILNPTLAVVSILSTVVLTFLLNRWVGGHTREGFRRQQAELGTLNGIIEETITGQRVVKAYHREETVIGEFDVENLQLRQASTKAQIYAGFVGPMMNFVGNISLAVIAWVGGWMAVQGMTSIGTIAAFMGYSRQLGRPLNDIANLYNQIQSALAGAERVFEVLDERPEVDALTAKPAPEFIGDVESSDVTFSYTVDRPTLEHISFRAKPGQTIALVGSTGAGKTTIVNLLTRFYEIDTGKIRIDGIDIHDIRKEDLRQQLGIVSQDKFLFAGTVVDNIRYGRLDATDDKIIAAAETANADEFIRRLPNGYQTDMTERGGNLSQGQRQLVVIARAVIADPRILILDEATSSVDTRTERHIQDAMLRMMEGRTSFVIAHRLSTIRQADQILV